MTTQRLQNRLDLQPGTAHQDQIVERLLIARLPGGMPVDAHMSAFTAHNLGFIDRSDRDRLADQARLDTLRAMAPFVDAVPANRDDLRQSLRDAMNCPARFTALIRDARYQRACPTMGVAPFHEVRTAVAWPEPVESLAAQLDAGLSGERLTWLAGHLFVRYAADLEVSMYGAWADALTGYVSTTQGLIEVCDTDLSKGFLSSSDP